MGKREPGQHRNRVNRGTGNRVNRVDWEHEETLGTDGITWKTKAGRETPAPWEVSLLKNLYFDTKH